MKRRLFVAILLLALLLLAPTAAHAQTYLFSLDVEIVHAYWQADGTLSLDYEFRFSNSPSASPMEYVDVGIPTSSYSLSNVSASVDGHPIVDIEYSPYVDGVALGLGSNAIPPGQGGTVLMHIDGIGNVLYEDDSGPEYASAVFSPNWFDSQYVLGSTDLTVIYHLPPGVGPDEPRWHGAPSGFNEEPITGFDEEGRVTYAWRNPSASAYQQYYFGASFPSQYVAEGTVRAPSFSQRTGISFDEVFPFLFVCGIFLFFIGIIVLGTISSQRRKLKYLPPKISIEGHGVKRGLTAIEAAILLEQPMDKILTMTLFSVVKKGAATVTKSDPLQLEIVDPLPKDLHPYETEFLEAFKEAHKSKRRSALQKMMVNLVREVARKMKGFSKRETTEYYRDIMERAWAQVEAAETPEVKSEKFDEVMEWTMLDKNYDDRTREVLGPYPVFVPVWWHRYDPGYGRGIASSTPSPSASLPTGRAGSAGVSLPGADFAASVAHGVQNFSSGVIGSLTGFTSGITNKTNPIPKSTYSGGRSSSSGGSSCACACACAGCACACAGGGR